MKIKIKRIQIDICEPCLKAEGEMCDTPGCALFMHTVDVLPIEEALYDVIEEFEIDDESDSA